MELLTSLLGHDNRDILWWQMCVRAVLILLVGIALIRLSGKRTFSRESPLDIIVTVVIGSNLSRAITGNAPFFSVIAASIILIVFYRVLAHACRRWGALELLLKGRPAPLVANGQVDAAALRGEAISQSDLDEALRTKGVDDPGKVRLAMLERSGQISVLQKLE